MECNFFRSILLISFLACHLTTYSQQGTNKNTFSINDQLIAASQAGAMPLYFDIKSAKIPLIAPETFCDSTELHARGGLPNFFNKIRNHQPVTIGYLGGSITRGDNMYRTQSANYIQNTFPEISFKGINAGVSGTGTELGACRVYEQLLQYRPDMVFIEFAVNGAFKDGLEGIVRQIWKFDPSIDICLLYTISQEQIAIYNQGGIPANIKGMEEIADYYNIPSIHLGVYPAKLIKLGKLIWQPSADSLKDQIIFSKDGLHPVEAGGNLYAAGIARAIQTLNKRKEPLAPHHLKNHGITKDNWEDAKMLDPKTVAQFIGDWHVISTASDKDLSQFAGWFPYIMKADKPGVAFEFTFIGKAFGFFDIGGPEAGQLNIEVDGKKANMLPTSVVRVSRIVDDKEGYDVCNRFNAYCNNRYRGQFEMFSVVQGHHHVKIYVSKNKADKMKILGTDQLTDISANPQKYDQTVFYLGKLLIRGDFIKN